MFSRTGFGGISLRVSPVCVSPGFSSPANGGNGYALSVLVTKVLFMRLVEVQALAPEDSYAFV